MTALIVSILNRKSACVKGKCFSFVRLKKYIFFSLLVKENVKAFHFLVKNTDGNTEWQKRRIELSVKVLVLCEPAFIAASQWQTMKPRLQAVKGVFFSFQNMDSYKMLLHI